MNSTIWVIVILTLILVFSVRFLIFIHISKYWCFSFNYIILILTFDLCTSLIFVTVFFILLHFLAYFLDTRDFTNNLLALDQNV